MIKIKRVYDQPESGDGFRILVDRIWPRGLSKGKADVDLWLKEIAPSDELRKWFGHEPEKWPEFRQRYAAELDAKHDEVAAIREHARKGTVTLLFGARDDQHNNAVVLKEYIESKRARKGKARKAAAR